MAMCMAPAGITIEVFAVKALEHLNRVAIGLVFPLLAFCSVKAIAQGDSDSSKQVAVRFSGYVDVYYAYDFGQSADDDRPPFLYQYDRHSEVDLNLGVARVEYDRTNVRAAFGLMAGTYAQANMIAEPALLQNLYEARVGFALNHTKELWIDAGVFPAHIGLESAIGIDNWTLTRSIVAENSPYYLSGAKVTWKPSRKVELAGLFMNGWQRIRRIQNNIPCFGTQVLWTMKDGMKLNWSTFAGSDSPDSLGYYRVFNNFWWSYTGVKWGVQLGMDVGLQEDGADGWDQWAGAVGIVRRKLGKRFFGVGRVEYYTDAKQVIVPTGTPHGLTAMGYSAGVDIMVAPDAFLRLEGRTFHGVDELFEDVHGSTHDNTAITVSLLARF